MLRARDNVQQKTHKLPIQLYVNAERCLPYTVYKRRFIQNCLQYTLLYFIKFMSYQFYRLFIFLLNCFFVFSLCVTLYSSFFCVLFRVADAFISFYHHPHIIMAHIDEIILNVISKLNLYKGLVFLLLLLLLFVNITSIIQHQ